MQHLPPDVFAAVLRQLPPADQGAVRLTCHAWRHRAFATLQHVTVRVPHAAECSPDAQQAHSAPLRLPTALCLLPAFTALRHLRIELPPHAERLPLHAGLPPCLQALTIVCSPDGKVRLARLLRMRGTPSTAAHTMHSVASAPARGGHSAPRELAVSITGGPQAQLRCSLHSTRSHARTAPVATRARKLSRPRRRQRPRRRTARAPRRSRSRPPFASARFMPTPHSTPSR